jgi:subtilase family serine protease
MIISSSLKVRFAVALLGIALGAGGCSSSVGSLAPGSMTSPLLAPNLGKGVTGRALCGPVAPGYGRCLAILRTDAGGGRSKAEGRDLDPMYGTACFRGNAYCYAPRDLQNAYKLRTSGGAGKTIAVVDAYDDPNAVSDLSVYRNRFGLPACTVASKCFRKVSGNGSTTKFPPPDAGWAAEESLDVDMASATCPHCHILLVEAVTNSIANLAQAENQAVKHGATVVSNSWGGSEYAPHDSAYDHPGVAITAGAGDDGYDACGQLGGCAGPQEPAAFASVIAVGGTSLYPDPSSPRHWRETTWNCFQDAPGSCQLSTIFATGSGCSHMVAKPAWQTDRGCTKRSYNDISAVADLVTGVIAYDSYQAGGWEIFGGTSVSTPIVAGWIVLAGQVNKRHAAKEMWDNKGRYFNDVTIGNDIIPNNGDSPSIGFPRTCPRVYAYICNARVGYDGPTGWGTP